MCYVRVNVNVLGMRSVKNRGDMRGNGPEMRDKGLGG